MFKIKPQKWVPTPYMVRAIKKLVTNHFFGLFLDPGLRKTSIALKAISVLKKAKVMKRVLVVAPLRVVYGVWPEEVKKWAEFNHLRVIILHGDNKERALRTDADIYVINPDGLEWLLGHSTKAFKVSDNFKILHPDALIVDESTQFKHPDTARFKLLRNYIPKFNWRWILTGTPVPNGLMDLFGQIFIIDRGRSLGELITHYRNEFFNCTMNYGVREYEIQKGADKIIQARLKHITLRLEARDYIELPDQISEPIWVELPPAARRIYDDMEEIMIAELNSGARVTAVNKGVAYGKCAQIANGGLYYYEYVEGKEEDAGLILRGPRIWDDIHQAKIEAMMEYRDSIQGAQLLIAYHYAHDLSRIQKALYGNKKAELIYLGGGVSPKRGVEIEQLWNTGKIRDLPGHPQSMGHGLNMQYGGQHILWHSPTDNLEHWRQFNDRVIRSGSTHKVVFSPPILARNTVDEVKWSAIKSKDKTQRGFLEALKVYVRNRR